MITSFELKNKSFCGCFMRTPFYIKNFFLLKFLLIYLALVFIIYFSSEGAYVKSITKVLRGLNSDTFNYLSDNRESLRMPPEDITSYNAQYMTSQLFYTECLRLNRACRLNGLAGKTVVTRKWTFNSQKLSLLAGLFLKN